MATIIQTDDRNSVDYNADETSWIYNGLDCAVTAEVWEALQADRDAVSDKVYELSRALQGPVLDMNLHGVLVDAEELARFRDEMSDRKRILETNLDRIIREGYGLPELNWRSPKQLVEFLYEYLGCPKQYKRNAKGGRSVTADRNALEKLTYVLSAQPLIIHLLALRDIDKELQFLATELDADGYMRSNFNIAGTNTGRMSSSYSDTGTGTNLQNIKRRLRRIFASEKGKCFVSIDLEQADSRNVGAECWNTFYETHGPAFAGSYLDACESGDLHTTVCRMSWTNLDWGSDPSGFRAVADQIGYRDFTYRDLAKKSGHGSNYLGTPPVIAMHTKIPTTMAVDFQRNYFSAFPCIPEWHTYKIQELQNHGCLTTILGRRRYFFARLNEKKTHGEAIAYLGQSATSDELNYGMLNVWRNGAQWPGFQLLVQVHDNIMFEVNDECINEVVPWALEAFQHRIILAGDREFIVPGEVKVGWNWGDYNDNPKYGALNPDGLKKWKGQETRTRQKDPVRRISFR